MSVIRIKTKCVLCDKELIVGPSIYVKYCELSDKDNGYGYLSTPKKIKDAFRVVFKGKSKKKVDGAIHLQCWNSLIETNVNQEKEIILKSKKNRLELVS